LCCLFLFICIDAKASDFPIIYSNGETFEKVLTLPNTEEFQFEYSERMYHGDLGIRYDQFCLFWIPLFNYGDKKYVLFNERKDDYVYVELTNDGIKYLQDIYGSSTIPNTPKPSFWNEWGGKLVALLIIALAWFLFSPDSEDNNKKNEKKK